MARDKIPGLATEQCYTDFCLPGKSAQPLLINAKTSGRFRPRQLKTPDSIFISKASDGIRVSYTDPENRQSTFKVDMVVLGPAMLGSQDAETLSCLLGIELDDHRFFKEANHHLDPTSSNIEGVFIAGCCQGPQNIPQSIAQGRAAAARILQQLVPGRKLPLPPTAAQVDENRCSDAKPAWIYANTAPLRMIPTKNRPGSIGFYAGDAGPARPAAPATP